VTSVVAIVHAGLEVCVVLLADWVVATKVLLDDTYKAVMQAVCHSLLLVWYPVCDHGETEVVGHKPLLAKHRMLILAKHHMRVLGW